MGGTLDESSDLRAWRFDPQNWYQDDGFEHSYRGPPFKPMVNRNSSECVVNVVSGRIKVESSGSKSPDVTPEADSPLGTPSLHDNGGLMSISRPKEEVEEDLVQIFEGCKDWRHDQLEMHFTVFFCLQKSENSYGKPTKTGEL